MKKHLLFLAALCCLGTMTATAQKQIQKKSTTKPTATVNQSTVVMANATDAYKRPGGGGLLPDSDGDGVTDQFDQEQTPPGCPVDSHGVSRDTDGDGVPDCRDKELVTPTVCQPVDADGVGKCPCPEDCGPAIASTGSANLHDEIHTQVALNKAQAEEINLLRLKIEELTRQINSFSIALAKEDMGLNLRAFSMPNPTQQYFTIRMQSGSSQPVSVRVLDATGKLIEERSGINANGALQLGEHYRSGTYLVEILQGNERASLRLIKQAN